jgi:hypothetical protein
MPHREALRIRLATIPDAAERLGYERSYWWRLTKGRRRLPDRVIRKARKVLGEEYPELDGLCIAALLGYEPATKAEVA